jgi:hypothetical protein
MPSPAARIAIRKLCLLCGGWAGGNCYGNAHCAVWNPQPAMEFSCLALIPALPCACHSWLSSVTGWEGWCGQLQGFRRARCNCMYKVLWPCLVHRMSTASV